MTDLNRLTALTMLEQRGALSPLQRAALLELRNRYDKKNQNIAGIVEPALTMATGAIAEPVSGFIGLAGLPFGGEVAANAVQRSQQGMTYQPKTEAGQRNLERLGGVFQNIADKVNPIAKGTVASLYGALPWTSQEDQDTAMKVMSGEGISGDLGDLVLDRTGSPALATLAHLYPAAMESRLGMTAASKVPGKQYEFGDVGGQAFGQRGAVGGLYRGQVGPSGLESPFDVTQTRYPTFTTDKEIATNYSKDPRASAVFEAQGPVELINSNVRKFEADGDIFDGNSYRYKPSENVPDILKSGDWMGHDDVLKLFDDIGLDDDDVSRIVDDLEGEYTQWYGGGDEALEGFDADDLEDIRVNDPEEYKDIIEGYTDSQSDSLNYVDPSKYKRFVIPMWKVFGLEEVQDLIKAKGFIGSKYTGSLVDEFGNIKKTADEYQIYDRAALAESNN